ncbi:MAG: cytidine deaminase [Defluviitaleaceae bacterium]|nr:cytidine deaminase [Defluviitaleaceae bacterium]
MKNNNLALEAVKAREAAYVPYSNFMVGAALLTKDGKIFYGCNIENAAYSPTICAERTAFTKAVSEGEREFSAIAVAGWAKNAKPAQAFPCGVCRQVMREFCNPNEFKVLVVTNENGDYTEHTLEELLPYSFGPESLM